MNFERLSTNVIDIINEILKNQKLVNYIGSNHNFPCPQTVDPKTIAPKGNDERIIPYPFDTTFDSEVKTQLHVYYPNIDVVNNGNVGRVAINFDVVVHKDIWLMLESGNKTIRPYQIVNQIVNTFKGKKIGGLGEMHFLNCSHLIVNSKFEGLRLVATCTEF